MTGKAYLKILEEANDIKDTMRKLCDFKNNYKITDFTAEQARDFYYSMRDIIYVLENAKIAVALPEPFFFERNEEIRDD